MKLTPEELRDIYARATSSGSGEHPAADLLARLLSGDVSVGERAKAVAHVATCARCAEEVRVARPVGDGLSRASGSVVRPAAWWRPAILLAVAAGALLVVGLALRLREPRVAPEGPYRAAESPGLRSLLPDGARLRRDAAVLRWAGAPQGVTFDVILADERLEVLARLPGLREPEVAVPGPVLAVLPSGAKLVWKVTVVQPDGTRTEARSFATAVE